MCFETAHYRGVILSRSNLLHTVPITLIYKHESENEFGFLSDLNSEFLSL